MTPEQECLRMELQAKLRECEEANDVREWGRTARKLWVYFPDMDKQWEVGPAFMATLLLHAEAHQDVLGPDALLNEGKLFYRRLPVVIREEVPA